MTSYTVLVVDDLIDIRELIQEILTEEGYKVTVASSAREAKEARRRDRLILRIFGCLIQMYITSKRVKKLINLILQ